MSWGGDVKIRTIFCRILQGDLTAVLNSNGEIVATYVYDAWGNHKIYNAAGVDITTTEEYTNHVGYVNPFRYRGYYYDDQLGLYYLKSRFYDPKVKRFISPDDLSYLDPETVNGLNLYAYCRNNPVMSADPSGHFAISTFLLGLAVSSLVTWGLSEIFGNQIVGGTSSILNGSSAIKTGFLLSFLGPWGIVAGVSLMLIGSLTIAFGVNEVIDGITGTNLIQQWSGWNDNLYNGIYTALNIVSSIGTIAGNMYMSGIRNHALKGLENAEYGPKASAHVGERSYYDSLLTQQEIVKYGRIRKATHGVKGFEFRMKGFTQMGESGRLHIGNWSLVYGNGTIWHFLIK